MSDANDGAQCRMEIGQWHRGLAGSGAATSAGAWSLDRWKQGNRAYTTVDGEGTVSQCIGRHVVNVSDMDDAEGCPDAHSGCIIRTSLTLPTLKLRRLGTSNTGRTAQHCGTPHKSHHSDLSNMHLPGTSWASTLTRMMPVPCYAERTTCRPLTGQYRHRGQ